MSSRLLDNKKLKQLQPAFALRAILKSARPPYGFSARSLPEAARWQRRARPALGRLVGFTDLAPAPLSPKLIEKVDRGDHVREKILLRTARDILMPVYILLPKKAAHPLPVVLSFHGHGYGVKDIVGLWEDGGERRTPDGYHKDFAIEICRRGFAVAAPEISCFGERRTDFSYLNTNMGQGTPSTCAHTAMMAFHLGASPIGLRVNDGLRLVDYLGTRRELDISRLGAMGISGGGLHTFYSTCLDERIRACVVSGYFCAFRDSILAMHHCPCNFVPGMWQFGEMADVAGLIAPRPMLVESGDHDGIFPVRSVKSSMRRAAAIYKIFGHPENLQADYFEGRHQISGRKAYDFLQKHLG
jgi:dienelactone hydrolase